MSKAQSVLVNFRLEESDKNNMEKICEEIGLSMSAAFTIFAKKVVREKRIPFDLNVDPFYSPENMKRLTEAMEDATKGVKMSEHDLIEVK